MAMGASRTSVLVLDRFILLNIDPFISAEVVFCVSIFHFTNMVYLQGANIFLLHAVKLKIGKRVDIVDILDGPG